MNDHQKICKTRRDKDMGKVLYPYYYPIALSQQIPVLIRLAQVIPLALHDDGRRPRNKIAGALLILDHARAQSDLPGCTSERCIILSSFRHSGQKRHAPRWGLIMAYLTGIRYSAKTKSGMILLTDCSLNRPNINNEQDK